MSNGMLHRSRVDEFKAWLRAGGSEIESGTGFQLFRFRPPGYSGALPIIFETSKSPEHLSYNKAAEPFVKRWLTSIKGPSKKEMHKLLVEIGRQSLEHEGGIIETRLLRRAEQLYLDSRRYNNDNSRNNDQEVHEERDSEAFEFATSTIPIDRYTEN